MDDRPLAEPYEHLLRGHPLFISFMTVGELYEGAYRGNWDDKRFRRMLRNLGRYTVIESSPEICRRWGEIRALRKRQPIAPDNAWVAATALVLDCPLVTHNPADFKSIPGLRVITAEES
jgi:predicted nucleic acid-binding protein